VPVPADAAPLWPDSRSADSFVVGIGESSLDHVLEVASFPAAGAKIEATGARDLPGGQVATAMRACARLGVHARLVTAVGDDPGAEAVLGPLRADGVDIGSVRRVPGARTRFAVILVEPVSGERTILSYRDAGLRVEPGAALAEDVASARALHLDAADAELATWAAQRARAARVPVFLDIDAAPTGADALLAAVDFPIVSLGFVDAWRAGGVEQTLEALSRRGARCPVVTLGAAGAIALWSGSLHRSPGFRVGARDTTGAGDVFHAAFLVAALEGFGVARTLRFANAAAAMNCRALGAQGGLPDRAEVDAFLVSAETRSG
jgi:sulfofructose kinase